MAIADTFGDLSLRVFVRRAACMVLGTAGVSGWAEWLQETLARRHFALGILHSTRADIRLLTSRPDGALADAERALSYLCAQSQPNPYVFGVTVRAQVQALSALGRDRVLA